MRKCAIVGSLFILGGAAAAAPAASLGVYGEVTITGDGYELTSDTSPGHAGYAGVFYTAPASTELSSITQLSADYEMTTGTFGPGAPRFTIFDTTNNSLNAAYVYWGTPQTGGSFTDPNFGASSLNPTGNYADGSSSAIRVQVNGFGGDSTGASYETWSQFVAHDGSVDLGFITVDLDAGFAGTQVMLLNGIDINGTIFNAPSVSGVPLPASIWEGGALFAAIGAGQLIRRRRRAAV